MLDPSGPRLELDQAHRRPILGGTAEDEVDDAGEDHPSAAQAAPRGAPGFSATRPGSAPATVRRCGRRARPPRPRNRRWCVAGNPVDEADDTVTVALHLEGGQGVGPGVVDDPRRDPLPEQGVHHAPPGQLHRGDPGSAAVAATRWASHNRTWLSDSLLTRTRRSRPAGPPPPRRDRPRASHAARRPARGRSPGGGHRLPGAVAAARRAPGPPPRLVSSLLWARPTMHHGCDGAPDRPGKHRRSRNLRVLAGFGRSPPVTWGGHGRHRHGGVPGHRQGQAGATGMSVAFDVVFGVFVVAILALAVIAIRWAVRRDRVARARQAELRRRPSHRAADAGTPRRLAPGRRRRSAPRDHARARCSRAGCSWDRGRAVAWPVPATPRAGSPAIAASGCSGATSAPPSSSPGAAPGARRRSGCSRRSWPGASPPTPSTGHRSVPSTRPATAGSPRPAGIDTLGRAVARHHAATTSSPRAGSRRRGASSNNASRCIPTTASARSSSPASLFERLEDSPIPLEVVATSLTDGRMQWFTDGPAAERIQASAALPALLPPVDDRRRGVHRRRRREQRAHRPGHRPGRRAHLRAAVRSPALHPAPLPTPDRGGADGVLHRRARPIRPRARAPARRGRGDRAHRRHRAGLALRRLLRHRRPDLGGPRQRQRRARLLGERGYRRHLRALPPPSPADTDDLTELDASQGEAV